MSYASVPLPTSCIYYTQYLFFLYCCSCSNWCIELVGIPVKREPRQCKQMIKIKGYRWWLNLWGSKIVRAENLRNVRWTRIIFLINVLYFQNYPNSSCSLKNHIFIILFMCYIMEVVFAYPCFYNSLTNYSSTMCLIELFSLIPVISCIYFHINLSSRFI